ncbi:MAG: beta-N-acetylhexosaminidase N-terminal domain-containing protein, partial [Acidobacteriota bacterium]
MQKISNIPSFAASVVLLVAIVFPIKGMCGQTGLSLIPKPDTLTMKEGKLVIDNHFSVVIKGKATPLLKQARIRFIKRLQKRTGLPLNDGRDTSSEDGILEIICMGEGAPVQSVTTDESYTLEVSETKARLTANSPVGIVRGLETLLQLVDIDEISFFIPSIAVNDRPRYNWRGLLID